MTDSPKKELVFISWYTKTAVYLSGEFVYFGDTLHTCGLLLALGYNCRTMEEVPTQGIPPEYDKDNKGWWQPPNQLVTFLKQRTAVKQRERQERIADLKKELAKLEGQDVY